MTGGTSGISVSSSVGIPCRERNKINLVMKLEKGEICGSFTYSDKVHLMGLPELGALDDFPDNVEAEEDGNVDVRNKEVGRVEGEEDCETVDEDEKCCPEDTPDAQPRLQSAEVHILRPVEALSLQAAVYFKGGGCMCE